MYSLYDLSVLSTIFPSISIDYSICKLKTFVYSRRYAAFFSEKQ